MKLFESARNQSIEAIVDGVEWLENDPATICGLDNPYIPGLSHLRYEAMSGSVEDLASMRRANPQPLSYHEKHFNYPNFPEEAIPSVYLGDMTRIGLHEATLDRLYDALKKVIYFGHRKDVLGGSVIGASHINVLNFAQPQSWYDYVPTRSPFSPKSDVDEEALYKRDTLGLIRMADNIRRIRESYSAPDHARI